MPDRKKFKFKIKGDALHVSEDSSKLTTFTGEVNQWYDAVGRPSLIEWFANKKVKDASYLEDFNFEDRVEGVEKEAKPEDISTWI
ncbi:hypothetical protein [Maribellus sediminis]|uniref:hypothetical protein n=1 Tax=Maribellus sediminis TaxID=2696285 RepID=UPI00142F53AC|nr:hypothetical protein [Maribellus sediminis]